MRHIGLIVAAGKGLRIGGDVPKQFMEVGGKPLLFYSLKAMEESFMDGIIVVTSAEWMDHVRHEIVDKYSFSKVTHVVTGGKERADSVYEGLKVIDRPEEAYVYIHDGARPMLSAQILGRVKEAVEKYGAVLAAVPSKDTVKLVDGDGAVQNTPDRKGVWLAQTPQTFIASELMDAYKAYAEVKGPVPTDDASVMELYGHRLVHVVMGDYSNIKVTTPEDFRSLGFGDAGE